MEEIREITQNNKEYPISLREIQDSPKSLFVKGKMPDKKLFAIVGTRQYSPYGKRVTLGISEDLTRAGLGIISGMAKGIDSFAHQACLEAEGETAAILGTGIDKESIYPKENLSLSQRIVSQGGCLISEFPPGTRGFPQNFPLRNRIISALSIGVLVIEAKKKSGALITARWAKQQNKKLFAIPGPIFASNSWGPNYLIKRGAKLVQSANDILKELDLPLMKKQKPTRVSSLEEKLIIDTLKQESLHIEGIIKKTGLNAPQVCSILSVMEIHGIVRNLGGNIYALRH